MKFYSTNNSTLRISLREAVLHGQPADGGLYMPERIPVLPQDFFRSLPTLSFSEIGFEVAHALLGDDLSNAELHDLTEHTLTFPAPVVEVDPGLHSLELFHGPTLAFKDFGARFLAWLVGYFARQERREMTILVATSGDTGGAVAQAFFQIPGTRVVVLYPRGRVSLLQEKQFATLGANITALEVDGSFDDCQRLVKQAFADTQLRQEVFLTSANSINIARLIPQMFYYFWGYAQVQERKQPVVFSVPSGNFGNLTAGLMAQRMGLPVHHFLAATNTNDVVPEYLRTGSFSPRASKATISNAMDVGNPSNFARMLALFNQDHATMAQYMTGYWFTDEQTRSALRDVYSRTGYVLDPHGAIGYLAAHDYQSKNKNCVSVFLETAHPAKFREVVEPEIGSEIAVPERLSDYQFIENKSTAIGNSLNHLREFVR